MLFLQGWLFCYADIVEQNYVLLGTVVYRNFASYCWYFCFLAYYKMHSEHVLVRGQCNSFCTKYLAALVLDISLLKETVWHVVPGNSPAPFWQECQALDLSAMYFITFIPPKSSLIFHHAVCPRSNLFIQVVGSLPNCVI